MDQWPWWRPGSQGGEDLEFVAYLIVLFVWLAAAVASFGASNEHRSRSRYDLRAVLDQNRAEAPPHYERLLRRVRKAVAGGVVFVADHHGDVQTPDGLDPLTAVMRFENPGCSPAELLKVQEGRENPPVPGWFRMRKTRPGSAEGWAHGCMRRAGSAGKWSSADQGDLDCRAALLEACNLPPESRGTPTHEDRVDWSDVESVVRGQTGWRRVGVEWHGPCPVIGGPPDMCWVAPGADTPVRIGCWHCSAGRGELHGASVAGHLRALKRRRHAHA